MKIKYLWLSLLFSPLIVFGKSKSEVSIHLKNALLLNRNDLKGYSRISDIKNTFQQNIGISAGVIFEKGILLSAGLDFGYERYSAKIKYPFFDFGYKPPAILGDQYSLNATIYYADINLNAGYKFKSLGKLNPEIRIGQILHIPINNKRIFAKSNEQTLDGYNQNNFESYGYYGKYNKGAFVGELVNSVYVGINIPTNNKTIGVIKLGLQYQKQLIFNDNPFNYFKVTYYDSFGFLRAVEEFRGSHSSIGLLLAVMLK